MDDTLILLLKFLLWAPPIVLAITLHEVAHGWMALRCGDTTAWSQGRLSLNPLRHVDPIGTVLVPAVLFFTSGFIFGWAKPVPVNYHRLRHPKQDMALVALAGPAANLLMLLGWSLVLLAGRLIYLGEEWPTLGLTLYALGYAGISINIVIGVLNMLPVPPLDGSRVLAGVLPDSFSRLMMQIEPFGLAILLILLATGTLGIILEPPIVWLHDLVLSVFG
jgi:Zn-dependent protease